MESIQDSLPEVDDCYARDMRGKFKKWMDELQGIQSGLVEVLDRDGNGRRR